MNGDDVVAIDLARYLNAVGATYDHERHRGAFNPWGNSYPAEELPFGGWVMVGGYPFRLPGKMPGCPDHVECLGGSLLVEPPPSVRGFAVLCAGEMGDQRAVWRIVGTDGGERTVTLTARQWLVADGGAGFPGLVCSHLHYPGGYELTVLRPSLSVVAWEMPRPWPVARIDIPLHPLFHVFALSLVHET